MPDWIERFSGTRPVLLLAPHGGRRPPRSELEPGPPRKSNDLRTAELTLELAERTGASAIVNRARDRNSLDLNRVSHVRRFAPWLFELLLDSVREQIASVGEARVLVVHGWNAIQAGCDVGIGARLDGHQFVRVREGEVTIPERFLPHLLAFAARCAKAGIQVTFGVRYPAAAKENLLQVFTPRYREDRDPAVRELSRLGAEGRIAAVQLELAVPLRWPGSIRDRFVRELEPLILASEPPALPGASESASRHLLPASPRRLSLEFHDLAAGIGGFTGIECGHDGRRTARFLVCLGRSRLGLFTGEETARDGLCCAGLAWTTEPGNRVAVHYDGPILLFSRTDPFLDLEAGLDGADLSHLQARLEWSAIARTALPESAARTGRVTGIVEVDGFRHNVDAPGVIGPLPTGASAWRERCVLHATFEDDLSVSVSSIVGAHESTSGEILRCARAEPLLSARIHVQRGPDGLTPEAFRADVVTRSGSLRIFGHVTTAVPVVRTGERARTLTVFGLARFRIGERTGQGTFEVSKLLDEPRAMPQG